MPMRVDTAGEAGRRIIGFPNPVNEKAARTVAGGVPADVLGHVGTQSHRQRPLAVVVRGLLLWVFIVGAVRSPAESVSPRCRTKIIAPRLGKPRLGAGSRRSASRRGSGRS